jgi:hypothetical protein
VIVACGSAADRAVRPQPGELTRLVAGGLTASGFDVRPPGPDGGCRMSISCPAPRCALPVTDCAGIKWQCRPWAAGGADSRHVVDLAVTLVTGRADDPARRAGGYGRRRLTLKGIVGLERKARGLDLGLGPTGVRSGDHPLAAFFTSNSVGPTRHEVALLPGASGLYTGCAASASTGSSRVNADMNPASPPVECGAGPSAEPPVLMPPANGWRQVFPGEAAQIGVVRRWVASLLPGSEARS